MKKLLSLIAITGVMLTSCSKKSNPTPTQPSNTVTIDGTTYTTAVFGNQTWTTVNYNGTGGVNYGNSTTNIPANGKLYTLAEANAITLPTGWRLPSETDFNNLLSSLGATTGSDGSYIATTAIADKLMAKTSWTTSGGTNSSGFNALAVGFYDHSAFDGTGTDAVFITTSMLTSNVPASFDLTTYQFNDGSYTGFSDFVVTSTDRASIRFVKDN